MTASDRFDREAADGYRATTVVVLGAGRSGTSAITRALTALGVDLGDNQRTGSGKNPTGFFEDNDILEANKRLKRALGIRGHSLRLIDDKEFNTPLVRAIQKRAIRKVGRRFADKPLWGYKYARTLRMLPFWQGVHQTLGLDVRYLLALRNPLSVARSRARLNPQRGRQVWSDMEWLVNVVPYLSRTFDRPCCVVDFDRLIARPEAQLQRMARDLKLPQGPSVQQGIEEYVGHFLQRDKPASRFSREDLQADPKVSRWVVQGYTLLDKVAGDELSMDADSFRQQWRGLEQDVANLGPLLAEFDHLRGQLVRAGWNPLSPTGQLTQLWRDYRAR